MKNLSTLLILILILSSLFTFSQSPNLINYQGLVRDGGGNIIANQQIRLKFTIIKNSLDTVYQEEHITNTNQYGLVNLTIGNGSVIIGPFSQIDWGNGMYEISISLDSGTGSYSILGISQLVSVPYALYANTAHFADSANVAGLPGPTGLSGPSGNNGEVGPTGPTGAIGLQGIPGNNGLPGSPGPTGLTGPTGPQGSIGPTGANGQNGINGNTGPTGSPGPIGPTGVMGPTGLQGIQGEIGLT